MWGSVVRATVVPSEFFISDDRNNEKARPGVTGRADFIHRTYLDTTTNATKYCMHAAIGNGRI